MRSLQKHVHLPVLLIVALAVFGMVPMRMAAQESTPGAADAAITVIELAPGVTAEVFGAAPSARAEGQTLYSVRLTFQPGAEIFPHSHPGTVMITPISGTLGWTPVAGTAQIVRGAGAGATEPIETVTEPGAEVLLEPGDAIFYEDDVTHTARGASDEPAVVFVSLILTAGEPLLMPAGMDMGTPAS